ncbi:DUF6708 domain-containing protein [Pseudomonas sp. URIL14HWK12:I5]|uniref:DUF6708 domain-containing protein n=1 Tax=Pseudomonas sp. URIL14HWK12:I5 TaxID=1261630 RepID=UPI0009D8F058|nr:DUF6708 domain-containing protein [Pseudomonas sp. URIL14HWK12:I5]SMD10178.1 hypothetical protein SAMN05660385_04282 [Pseudomonas sp. URIL14HWK12:I5]
MMVRSKGLWKRAMCWSYDLPQVSSQAVPCFNLDNINPSPNYLDDVYLELSRSTVGLRGVAVLLGVPGLVISVLALISLYWDMFHISWSRDWHVALVMILAPLVGVWAVAAIVKIDLTLPRDEPIRFNRHRRKIYLYQYKFHYIYLFSHKHWGVKPIAYDWDDVTAEVYRVYAPGHGGVIENVKLSVRNPETNEVIDRVVFTSNLYRGEAYWAIARLFMQQGPEALPKFVHPPRDWNDDDGLSHMHCLAPKVVWPADIDRESRTAPSEGETQ